MSNEYPRDGETYSTSAQKTTKKPTHPLATKGSIQENMIAWLQQGVDFAGDIDNIQTDVVPNGVDRQVSIEAQVLAHKLLKDLFISKQVEFKEFLDAQR